MKKFYSIEILRFLTSLSVLLFHYRHFFGPWNTTTSNKFELIETNLPFYSILENFYTYGFYGVHVFYTMSGFVFAHIYLTIDEKVKFKNFFVNRFARLYPLHFATLFIVIALQFICSIELDSFQVVFFNDFYHFMLQLFFISAWGFEEGHSFNGPIWSISVEIAIYFIFFLLIGFLNKHKIYLTSAVIILLILVAKFTNYEGLFLECARLFFSGVLVYFICSRSISKYLLSLISIVLIVLAFVGNFKTFLFCPALVMLFITIEPIITKSSVKIIFNNLGNLTYSLYLLHVPLQIFFILSLTFFDANDSLFLSKYFFIIFFLTIFTLAYCSFKYYEKPMNKIIRFKLNEKNKS